MIQYLYKCSYCLRRKKQAKAKEKKNYIYNNLEFKSLGYINMIGVNEGEGRKS